ncbi:hypothetical protein K7432_010482 [Basidiobolus ranarum]|uniref:IucC family-domain-containing protein n=1 Tax=Basidiobolus ranarum TaxID=34480 RepID=A0ABR2WNM7_9FUNG
MSSKITFKFPLDLSNSNTKIEKTGCRNIDILKGPIFPNLQHKAYFATFSRLAACLVNESLVHSRLINAQILGDTQHKWWCVIANSEFENEDDESLLKQTGIFLLPMLHRPIVDDVEDVQVVRFVDPMDCDYPAYVAHPNSDKVVHLAVEIDPCILLRQIGQWRNIEASLIESICGELLSSVEHTEHAYRARKPAPTWESSSIEWEQSIIEGHATHPMHKARFAVPPLPPLPSEADLSTPDICFVAVPRQKVMIRGDFEKLIQPALSLMSEEDRQLYDSRECVILPVHEIQLPNVFDKFPFAKLLSIRQPAKALAALRTVSLDALSNLNLKLSIGIKVSSSMRTITPWTTYLGPALRPVIDRVVKDKQILKIADELASAVIRHDDTDIAKHLSCIVRQDTDLVLDGAHEKAIVCCSLVERDADGESYVVKTFELNTHQKRLRFFQKYAEIYLQCFVNPVVHHGFTFEAHGQNVIARFDAETRELVGFIVRDFGGIKVHQETLKKTIGMSMDVLPNGCVEAENLEDVYHVAFHTMFNCHIHRLIRALDLHYSGEGWSIVREVLNQLIPQESLLHRVWLETPEVDLKCFIQMKLGGLYRDYIYCKVPNLLLYQNEFQVTQHCRSPSPPADR